MRWKAIIFTSHFNNEENTERYETRSFYCPKKVRELVAFVYDEIAPEKFQIQLYSEFILSEAWRRSKVAQWFEQNSNVCR